MGFDKPGAKELQQRALAKRKRDELNSRPRADVLADLNERVAEASTKLGKPRKAKKAGKKGRS